jgi:hypothetical protein
VSDIEFPEDRADKILMGLSLDKETRAILRARIVEHIKGAQKNGFDVSRFGTLIEMKTWLLSLPFCQSCAKMLRQLLDKGGK